MVKFFLLLLFQIKAACRELPKIIAATIIFSFIVFLIGFGGTKLLNQNKENNKMDVAVVLPPNADTYTTMAFSFLSEIDTVKNVCNFIQMDKDAATNGLKNGTIYAAIMVPDNFVNHIIDGTNTPADIILPRSNLNTKSMLFRTLVNAGVTDLSAAQAGIYAVDDVCNFYKIKNGVSQSEKFLNDAYFSYALNRSIYFRAESVSSVGSLTQIQIYLCSGIILLLLLSGIACYDLLRPENPTLSISLRRRGMPISILYIFKAIGVSTIYYLLILFAYMIENLAELKFPVLKSIIINFNFLSYLSLFILVFMVFAMILFLFQLSDNHTLSMLLLFILSIIMMFMSGAFVPSSILPEIMQKAATFLPTTYFTRLCGEIITNTTKLMTILQTSLFGVLFIGGAQLMDYFRQKRI